MNFFRKIDIFYIATILFLLMTANANFLSQNNAFWFVAIAIFLVIALSRKSLGRKDLAFLGIFSLIYLAFVTIRDLFVNDLDSTFLLSDALFLFKYILLTFSYVVVMKDKIFAYLVKAVVHLTAISLFLFFLQVIGLKDFIYSFSQSLHLPSGVGLEGYTNFLIYSLTVGRHDYSNSGFMWEPGAFGCILCITLMFNFFLNGFRFDGKSIILILGIITTFSTTTYVGLLIILFFSYRFRVPKINKWFFLSIPLVVAVFIMLPFLGTKILNTYNEDMVDLTRLKFLERYYHKQSSQIPLNRFSSMAYISDAFGPQLILGVSNKYDAILNKKNDVNISNGIFDFMAKFGVVGLLFLFFCYLKVCWEYLRRAEFLIYCGLTFLVIGFGEPVLQLPFILLFLFYPLLSIKPVKQKDKKSSKRNLAT